ncbi:MAG: aminotransferase class III-fold pyridoxal phosphate-dependent enzyme, partial [Bacteroidales bacterium]|nr:aminotransferase class III-fold pyridoxal phosphate-dependent enzyme [Bacteroidales bacterium]
MLKDKPRLGIAEIAGFVKEKYGLEVSCVEMDGERDQNVLLTDRDGSEYVLKITNPCEEDAFIEAQNDVLKHLSAKVSLCPELIKDRSGRDTAELVLPGGEKYRTRLVSYLKGKTLGALKDHPVELISDLGSKLGKIDAALQAYENEAFNRDFIWDLANFERVVTDNIGLVNDDKLSAFTRNTLEEYRDIVKPESANLRRSLIHNDANDHNVIVSCDQGQYTGGPEIKGFIDFGDMVYSYTVADPAVAMAYIMPGKDEPLRAAAEFLSAYNKTFRLTDNEVRVIFTMAKMRLALSICIAVLQKKERPDDNYLGISQEPISSIIPVLGKIHPLFAEAVFREACGMDQAKGMQEVLREIKECGREAYPVLGEKLSRENCLVLDLGAGSDIIDGDPENNTASKLGERINERLNRHRKKFGIGRYMEPRILYSSPVFQGEQFLCKQDRTIHLGMDLFAPEGSAVHAPADASVYLFSYNPGELDYGHMIILEHKTAGNNSFYTLYGHLSKKSVSGLSKGKKLKKGDIFAWVGNSRENGGWSPHLHFQVITKLLDYGVDFPGVCKPWERGAWLRLSPDPNIILNIPAACFPVKEAGKEITYEKRKQYFTGNLSLSYRKPLKMVRGWRQYLFDEAGQKYLDSYNNVPHIGHCHPEVTEAVYEQMRLLNTNTRYLNDRINEFAELLTATFPQSLEVCFFLNSASEANELALRLAFTYTGRRDLIVLEGAYHGNTSTLIDISPYKHDGPGGRGAPDWVHKAPQADPYRGEYKYHDRDAGKKYAQYVEGIISDLKHKGRSPAAFIAETCPSVGGQIIFPQGY